MEIGFALNETVRKRYSVRTYAPTLPDAETKEKILAFAAAIENPFQAAVQVQFIEKRTADNGEKLGTYGFIKGAQLFLGVTVEDKEDAALAVGYVFEELVLYMTSLGLGTCWLGGTFNKSAFAKKMKIADGCLFPILSPVGLPAKPRMTEKLFRVSLQADNRLPAEKLFFADGFEKPLDTKSVGAYAACLENVRLAPSARNLQPWRVVYDGKAFHFFKKGNMHFMQMVDLGIALNHFVLTAKELGLQGRLEKTDVSRYPLEKDMKYVASWVTENV